MSYRWEKAVGIAALTLVAACQQEQAPQAAAAGPAKGTKEWKIQNAMSAAPRAIASDAAILDYPSTPNGQMVQLRAGTNGWTCMPDDPSTPSNDPVCGDSASFAWYAMYLQHKPARITKVALTYMLQGAADASNTDPFQMKPDSGQPWVTTGPHIMMFFPDPKVLQGMNTDWRSRRPYVMWAGTPYAHLMIPTGAQADTAASGSGMGVM